MCGWSSLRCLRVLGHCLILVAMRYLLIRGGAIGDFILTLPGMCCLREQNPDAHIEILGYPRIACLALGLCADRVRAIDERGFAAFFARGADLDPAWKSYIASFDCVVSWLYDPDHILETNILGCGAQRFLCNGSPRPTDRHAAEHFSSFLRQLGIPAQIQAPSLTASPSDHEQANRFFQNQQRRWLALHPGSGSAMKNWPLDQWKIILERAAETGANGLVLVTGEAENDSAKRLIESVPSGWPCLRAASLPLSELAAILRRCSLFVGHDSGISHLAAACGIPTVCLFGPTDPKLWAPRGSCVKVIQKGTAMIDILPEDLISACREIREDLTTS